MNRKQRRTFHSLARRRKWHVLGQLYPLEVVFNAREAIGKRTNEQRRSLALSEFAKRHEIHRRGTVLLRLYA